MINENSSGEENVRELINCIVDHPRWTVKDDSETFSGIVERALNRLEKGRTVEYRINHTETGGVLLCQLSAAESGIVLKGTLEQALDRRQNSNTDTDPFLNQLVESHSAIAEKHESKYITPLSDPVSILRIQTPTNYQRKEIKEILDTVSRASREIQGLHDELVDTLQRYSRNP